MGVLQHGLGDATFCHRELGAGGGDAVGDLQLSHATPSHFAPAGQYLPQGPHPRHVHTVACSFPHLRNDRSPATTLPARIPM